MSGRRVGPIPGEWINRNCPLDFRFEGRTFKGLMGDTVSSALWAAGQQILGRSFKYHRVRGILSFANHDVNVLLQSNDALHLRGDICHLERDLDLRAVNHVGSLEHDGMAFLDRISIFLPVGFYYKAFYRKSWFPFWEKIFRRVAGLGTLDLKKTRQSTPKEYDFCDIAVIGAGPSGLAAAWAAAEQGAQVLLIDENLRAGGSGLYQRGRSDEDYLQHLQDWCRRVLDHPRIRLRLQTTVSGYYTDHWLALVDPDKMIKLRARSVVVATGAIEQPAVFRNNDLPGVMLGSAAQRLLYRHAVAAGDNPLILAGNDDAYRLAEGLLTHGIVPVGIVELRSGDQAQHPSRDWVRTQGIPVFDKSCIVEANADPETGCVASVVIAPFHDWKADYSQTQMLPCDSVLMSVGWAPAANLLYQAGARMVYDTEVEQFVPEFLPQGVFACGRVNGCYGFANRFQDGLRAGQQAAASLGHGRTSVATVSKELRSPNFPWPIVPHKKGKNFVDFDEDIQLKDYMDAAQEGFDNIELMKRFTTNGMGPSQGKHSNMNALRILGSLLGVAPDIVGTTTARPFYHPVPLAHLAGRRFHPYRQTPLHAAHVSAGAQMILAGDWWRPEYYRMQSSQDRRECIHSEVRAVRNGVGLIDVSTLGKLEVYGPQAAEFLERVYVSRYARLKVGMTRYGVQCDEGGIVVDDGVVARLSEDHFYVTTTSSAATTVYREWSRWNTWWKLDCVIINLTGTYAAMNLAGPDSRSVLHQVTQIDLSGEAFPYLAIRDAEIAGIPAHVLRVGFVGEWGYEIHVPANSAKAVWDAILAAGEDYNIRPFGIEAQRILRLEKGHIIVGQDTDGLSHPYELGLGWTIKMDKPYFVGQRSLLVLQNHFKQRRLRGFRLHPQYEQTPPAECHLVIHQDIIIGRVTSIAYSLSLNAHVGLVLLDQDMASTAVEISIRLSNGEMVYADLIDTPFYDPDHSRQREVAA